MAQIDKIQVQSTTYDVAQSSAASFTGTSNDTASPTGWTDVNVLGNTETNGSIFTKISKMFANIRWLYNQLGTTDYSATGASTVSAALSALQSGKAASSHSHGVSDLPVTDQQNNSSSTIPTSALIYSMNQTLTSLNDAYYNINGLYKFFNTSDYNLHVLPTVTTVTLNISTDASIREFFTKYGQYCASHSEYNKGGACIQALIPNASGIFIFNNYGQVVNNTLAYAWGIFLHTDLLYVLFINGELDIKIINTTII